MKSTAQLIAYYTRKVAQYGSVHPSKARPRANKFRYARLMAYKTAMHKRITSENRVASFW